MKKAKKMKIILLFQKESLCGKWTIFGTRKTCGHNSGLVLRISFYFYIMRETKRCMKVISMVFSKDYGGGQNGGAFMMPDGYSSCWFNL